MRLRHMCLSFNVIPAACRAKFKAGSFATNVIATRVSPRRGTRNVALYLVGGTRFPCERSCALHADARGPTRWPGAERYHFSRCATGEEPRRISASSVLASHIDRPSGPKLCLPQATPPWIPVMQRRDGSGTRMVNPRRYPRIAHTHRRGYSSVRDAAVIGDSKLKRALVSRP